MKDVKNDVDKGIIQRVKTFVNGPGGQFGSGEGEDFVIDETNRLTRVPVNGGKLVVATPNGRK